MKLNTATRIFLSMLTACVLVLVVNGIIGLIGFERSFLQYINEQSMQRMQQIAANAASAYQRQGGWAFLEKDHKAWFRLVTPPGMKEDGPLSYELPVSDQAGVILRMALLDAKEQLVLGNPAALVQSAIRMPIQLDGQTIGWLTMLPLEQALDPHDVHFYQSLQRSWWLNIATSVIIAALLSWLVSRLLVRRLRALANGISTLASGNYSARIEESGGDEVGRLILDVNHLAEVLEHTEQTRRDFMADISHELRTPLAVLRAELEAIEDGIRPMRPDSLAALQMQVRQLGKLIDDLHELSMSQAEPTYQFTSIDVVAALNSALVSMLQRFASAGITFQSVKLPIVPLLVQGDERRLRQLFTNLLENTVRYTDRGGQANIRARTEQGKAIITIEDSAPGVDNDKCERLFERFYRVETSRSRASGGSGLGLAICSHIVRTHGGTITAEASALGGLRITITFPLIL